MALWERSVRATHAFLAESDIQRIKGYVPDAIRGVETLVTAEESEDLVGFMGIQGDSLEMLFVDPARRGRGVGRKLLTYGIERVGVTKLTVNEQNPQAIGFYEHMGFKPYKRTENDEAGDPFPLIYMRLEK